MALNIPAPVGERLRNIQLLMPKSNPTPPATYPSAYWNNRKQKPDLSIPQGSISSYYYKMHYLVHELEWNDDIMAGYLVRYIQTYPGQFETSSPTEWKSNDIVLAKVGEVVNPLTLLDIKDEENFIMDPEANAQGSEESRLHHFVSLIMACRKSRACLNNQMHGAMLGLDINNQLKNSKFPVNSAISSNFTYCNYSNIATTKFVKVLSAIDMFYFRFPDHPAAVLRLGTISLRFDGCAVFSSLKEIAKKLRMTIYELKCFIFCDDISKEILNVMKTGEYDSDPYGYFPYCLGLGIVTRSPYSISQSPSLYIWLHTIGCLLGVARSYNAKMPKSAVEIVPTIHAAVALASIAGELNDTLDGEEEIAPVEDTTIPVDPDQPAILERRRQQAAEFLSSLKRHEGLSRDQEIFLKTKAVGLRNCPPNSIGLYLHKQYSRP